MELLTSRTARVLYISNTFFQVSFNFPKSNASFPEYYFINTFHATGLFLPSSENMRKPLFFMYSEGKERDQWPGMG